MSSNTALVDGAIVVNMTGAKPINGKSMMKIKNVVPTKSQVLSAVPIITTVANYNWQANGLDDLIAGITTGVMLIPQGMAYALLATLPPQYGLYSAILPIIMYALFGTSRQLAIGPVAIISLLIAEAIEPPHVIDGIAQTNEQMVQYKVELATVIAFFVGVFSLVLGLVRAGQLSTFLSHSVLVGFVSGASVVIALSQLKHVLGFTTPKSHYPIVSAYHYLAMLPQTNVTTLSIGLVGIVFLLGARHVKKRFGKPVKGGGVMANRARKALGFICSLAALEAVIAGTLITTYLYDAHGHQPSTG